MSKHIFNRTHIFLSIPLLVSMVIASAGQAMARPPDNHKITSLSGDGYEFPPAIGISAAASSPNATFTVTNPADSGPGSLRQAILDANASPGLDTIAFAIGSTGSQQTIQPASALPTITGPVTIDGWSQGGAGYVGLPLIEINGALAGSNVAGLNITAGGSTVRGLVINGFSGSLASGLRLQAGGDNWIYGNYIGTNFAGDTRSANQRGIWIDGGSSNNRIGTDADGVNDAAERNVISSNIDQNIWIYQPATTGNKIMGNHIGVNAGGTAAVGTNNQTVAAAGILVQEASYTVIGTDGDGQGDALEGNVISGSILNINLTGTSNLNESHHNCISGNRIGTNASGTASVGIQVEGVRVYVGYDNLIGTDGDGVSDALEGNVISGHFDWGVMLQQTGARNTVVAGNRIGMDITGMLSIPNGYGGSPRAGIQLGGYGNRVGTNSDGVSDDLERNLISGNSQTTISAIYFNNLPNLTAPPTIIAGNWMGVDATGLAALPNNYGISGTSYAPTLIRDNVIAANTIEGISTHSSGMLIIGNRIGVGADGVTPLGNGQNGLFLSGNDNVIGGTGPGEANIIANNGTVSAFYSGVRVGNTGLRNAIRGNSIYANSQLGIDLRWPDGVNINDDGDPDTGGNNLQNFPVLNAATAQGANVVVSGTLNSNSNTTFLLDFYSNAVCDSSGHGEGEVYLGAGQVTTDANGDASFTISVAGYAGNGDSLTATATHADGSTSEFSTCVQVVGEVPISGLQASNNGPTQLGYSTQLNAIQTNGTGVSYAWDFGDGTTGTGANLAHIYTAVGVYTATVTAMNSLGSAQAETIVTILPAATCTATHNNGAVLFGSSNAAAVQQAVGAASAGDTVKIAGNCAGAAPWNGSYQTVFIDKPLILAGGYTAGNWTTPDPINTPTVLDALSLGRVVFINAASAVTLENLILANGNAAGSGTGNCPGYGCGGGLFTYGSLNLINVTIRNNSANRGGGAYVTGSLQATNTTWQGNIATDQRGGAFEVYGDGILDGGVVQGNSGSYGGGFFADASLTISGTHFINNIATSISAGSGGAIYAAGQLDITNALFEANQSYTGGGAVIFSPGAANETMAITGTQFINNTTLNNAAQGGALYATRGTIQSSTFQGNSAPGSSGAGGAIAAFQALTLTETTLISNTTGGQGGAIYHWGLSETGNTSQVYPLIIQDSRLAGNQAGGEGGGLYFRRGFAAGNTPTQITHTTFEGNTAALAGGGAYLGQPGSITTSLLLDNHSTTAAGGGLYTEDRLTLTQTAFQGNRATRAGAAYVSGALDAVDTDWVNNTGSMQRGGAFEVYGDAALTGGLVQGNAATYAGGIFADAGLTISGTHFINNRATSTVTGSGGAVYAAGSLDITHALFEGNQSYTGGGAILHAPGTDEFLTIANTQFINNTTLNTSAQGGGLYTSADKSTIHSSTFQGNSTPGSSGAGGALVAFNAMTLTETILISNTAGGDGGAIYHWGLSETGQTSLITTLSMTDTLLTGNAAGNRGGGLYFRLGFAAGNVPLHINRSTFRSNTASQAGGGAYLPQPFVISASIFRGNVSLNAVGGGAAIQTSASSRSQVLNSIFADNRAATGSAALQVNGTGQLDLLHTTLASAEPSPGEALGVDGAHVQITNTIIANHAVGILATGAAVVSSEHGLFQGNLTDTQGSVANLNPVFGNPNFLDPASGDYHLALGSAAIDAAQDGVAASDYDGDLRPIVAQADIGADEFGSSAVADPGATTELGGTVSPGHTYTVTIPSGAVVGRVTIGLLPVPRPGNPPPVPRRTVGFGFILLPVPGGVQHGPQVIDPYFLLPVEITLTYTDEDLAGLDENSLFLAVWDADTAAWVDAAAVSQAAVCPGSDPVTRELAINRITVKTCATGGFALLADPPAARLYLPVVQLQAGD